MKLTLEIQADNAAFADEPATELARILREAAEKVEEGYTTVSLRDINGNVVGNLVLREK